MTSTGPTFHLHRRQILVGITGGIAAYKSAELVRLLQKAGASVRVIMTRAATEFITPLTLQALSGKPVHLELLDAEAEAGMGHIELARWADAIVVAPASADFLARLASGRGDDLLSTVCLASRAPLCLAPAMNQQMWKHPATQENCQRLRERGVLLFGPAAGEQACGDVGPGRMLEAVELLAAVDAIFPSRQLEGVRMVITAGPTREAIDPVRYLSNHSSGKMGYALARAATDAGAEVTLITGPTHLPKPERTTVIEVVSAQDMHAAALESAQNCDIFIGAAAVADFRPAAAAGQKIKKGNEDTMTLTLVKNPDIIADVSRHFPGLWVVGFAAETQLLAEHARGKLRKKGLHMIIANDVADKRIGFNSDENAVTVVTADQEYSFPAMQKTLLARELIGLIANRFHPPHTF